MFIFIALSNLFSEGSWVTTEYIWNMGVVACCNKGKRETPWQYFSDQQAPKFDPLLYQDIQHGDIVFVQCRFLADFFSQVFPFVQNAFVLVVADGDESFPSECGLNQEQFESLINDARIAQVFAQNYDGTVSHPKIHLLPIGIDYHTIAYKGSKGGWGETGSPWEQEAALKNLLSTFLPTSSRKKRAYVDFQYSDSIRYGDKKRYLQLGEDRTKIFLRLMRTGVIDCSDWKRRTELWKTKGEYAFSISPHGNGLDCHRTWEDLILGCIVIVKSSPLDPLYDGLPVVIVKDWSEVSAENMEKWRIQYGDVSNNPTYREKITHQYWMNQIKQAVADCKGGID